MRVGQSSESDAVDGLGLPFYSSRHPTGSHGWGIAVIWEILIEESMRIRVFGDTAINTGVYAIRGKRRLVYENPHPE